MKSFDTINRSNRHMRGFALRFFRIKRIRDDKTVRDIDPIEKVINIIKAKRG